MNPLPSLGSAELAPDGPCAGCGEDEPRHYVAGAWWCDLCEECELYDLGDEL